MTQYVSWTDKVKEFIFTELKNYQKKSNIVKRRKTQQGFFYINAKGLHFKAITVVLNINKPMQRKGICRKFIFHIPVLFIIFPLNKIHFNKKPYFP